jgi:hypothetical protein
VETPLLYSIKGGEIGLFKTLINKGFPRLKDFLSNVWQYNDTEKQDRQNSENKLEY